MEINFFDAGEMLGRFNLLMRDVLSGESKRNGFERWEVELLIDIAGCRLAPERARDTLLRYQRAAAQRFETGRLPPMKLSEYLRDTRLAARVGTGDRGQVCEASCSRGVSPG